MSVESLLSHTDWLRALCRQLVRDADRADELFQESVLAGLRDGAAARGALRPWLGGVVQNLLANRSRAERRRREREAAAPPAQPSPSTAEVVARVAMQERVIAAVRSLPETQRDVVLLRYFEDLPPRAIAARLGLGVDTVKTRLKRGLAALRERLDAEYGDRQTWVVALLPIAGQGAAATLAPVVAVSWALAAVALLVSGFVWLTWPANSAAGAPSSGGALAAAAAATAEETTPEPFPTSTARTPVAAPTAESDASGFVVEVVDRDTGAPVPGATVRYARSDAGAARPADLEQLEAAVQRRELTFEGLIEKLSTRVVADAHGRVRIPRPQERGATFSILAATDDHDGGLSDAAPPAGNESLRLAINPTAQVAVRVLDANGQPAGGVPVDYLIGDQPFAFAATPTSGAPVRLKVRYVDPESLPLASVRAALPLAEAVVATPTEGTVELRLPPTAALDLEVRDNAGEPIAAGEFAVHRPSDDPQRLALAKTMPELALGEEVTRGRFDAGRVQLPRVEVGTSWRLAVRPSGYAETWFADVTAPQVAGARGVASVAAPSTRRVWLRVFDRQGRPLANRPIAVEWATRAARPAKGMLDPTASFRVPLPKPTPTSLRLTLVATGGDLPELSATVDLASFGARATEMPLDVQVLPLETLVAGRVVDRADRPVGNATVSLRRLDADGRAETPESIAKTNEAGRFELRGATPALRFDLAVTRASQADVHVEVARGETNLKLRLPSLVEVTGTLTCAGAERDLFCRLIATADATQRYEAAVDDDGSYAFGAIPADGYTLQVEFAAGGQVLHRQGVVVDPAAERVALPPLDLMSVAPVRRLTIRTPDGTWPDTVQLRLRAGPRSVTSWRTPDERGGIAILWPAGAQLTVSADGFASQACDASAADCTVDLRPQR